MHRRRLLQHASGLLLAAWPGPARAAERYDVALIPGRFDGRIWQAGIDIRLAPGWKTYWRMPGDAGIPPLFGWEGSANALNIETRYPAPRRFADAYGETVGYQDGVIFPLSILPEDPAVPVGLRLSLSFAVCRDVCIPAKAEAALDLSPVDASPDPRIAAAELLVPQPGRAISRVTVGAAAGRPHIDLTIDQPPEGLDIFVEGGGLAYFRKPERLADGRFRISIANLADPSKLRGRNLSFTLVGPQMRLEQTALVE